MQGARLASMLPHAGAMVLLDAVTAWGADWIRCRTRSHRHPGNPLRRQGRISAICGVEYGLQAAALHGAMRAGGVAQRAGYVARLRDVVLTADFLDQEGLLSIDARLERQEGSGMVYHLAVSTTDGRLLVSARASIALPS